MLDGRFDSLCVRRSCALNELYEVVKFSFHFVYRSRRSVCSYYFARMRWFS